MKSSHRKLPRLEREYYVGSTSVHWTFCTKDRVTGWLDSEFHNHFREVLTHAGARYGCVAPIYCLMPDHIHVLLLGLQDDANLYLSSKFLRQHTAKALLPAQYQKQAYDHVLTEKENERGAFEAICFYIAENPVRADLSKQASEYPFCGSIVPGYPNLRIYDAEFWELFWKLCHRLTAAATSSP
jgi:REP element-mobilizing transposase RayT